MIASFARADQYEAAGTVFMADPVVSDTDEVTISQIEGAMSIWSEEAYRLSSKNPQSRRLSFDVPLPVMVVDSKVAQRLSSESSSVVMAEPLPMLAGSALVITWYAAMSEALQAGRDDRVMHLLSAALSVPIRMRLLPESDGVHMAALSFLEALFVSSAASGADSLESAVDVGLFPDG